MGVDVIVHYPCDPKYAFGQGDQVAGVYIMLDMIKARNRAEFIEQLAVAEGKDPEKMEIQIVEDFGGRQEQRTATIDEMRERAKPLDKHDISCSGCPANTTKQPYGCSIGVPYPITTTAQGWLLNQLEPAGTTGRDLFISLLERYELRGKYIQFLRRSGFFEQGVATDEKVLDMPLFSDLVFDVILSVGEYLRPVQDFRVLPPKYALALLICFGCLRVDGHPPRSKEDLKPVEELEGSSVYEDRLHRAPFDIGERSSDLGIANLQGLLYSVYTAWVVQAPLLVWS